MDRAASVPDFIVAAKPDFPVFCFRPHLLKAAAQWFVEEFPGEIYYAVKANPAPHILQGLWDGGVRGFDVASAAEVEAVSHQFPQARLAFMHPIKNRNAIARAYFEHGVRRFVLDSFEELQKILEATGHAKDLTLVVRIGVSNDGATVPLTGKFGASEDIAPDLLRATRHVADELGVSFHVGSQAMNPGAWPTAMAHVSRLIRQAAVTVDIVDVGGGFPAAYNSPPALRYYADAVDRAFEEMMVLECADLWSEPGRALCAEAESLLVRVEGVKDGALHLNDGGFGALYDGVNLGWNFPVRALRADGELGPNAQPYTLYGPTCDSADKFAKPVYLPEGLCEGDYIEFGNVGAYGRAMASRFNGFGAYDLVEVADQPFASAYVSATPLAEPASATATLHTLFKP